MARQPCRHALQVKFVFISFLGEGVGVMRKAKVSTLKGTVSEIFTPFHAELISATTPGEVTTGAINELVGQMFGKTTSSSGGGALRIGQGMVKVTQKNEKKEASAISERQDVEVSEAVRALIQQVRDDSTPTDWCLCGLNGGPTAALTVVGSGEGGAEALAKHLMEDGVFYGLVRTTEQIDNSTTVKVSSRAYSSTCGPPQQHV
jgi:hypothetical protein